MAIRQSVLALHGAISHGLTELRQSSIAPRVADDLRTAAWELTGLTGNAGERGWYDELFCYFDDHRTGTEPVVPPSYDDIHADLESRDQTLAPTWAARAIAAAYVLDRISEAGVGPARNSSRFLEPTLAASPAGGLGFQETGRVGPDDAQNLARLLIEPSPSRQADFWGRMRVMSGTISPAVASLQMTAGLRKVKREYCSVTTTTAEWPDISYTKLQQVIEPSNWSKYYQQFFCSMTGMGDDDYGWTRVHEAVSGECSRYWLRTGLKFWKSSDAKGLFINYDLDADRTGTDKLVLVDNGYIWIKPLIAGKPAEGVRVRTSKQLLISGMSATALTKLAESMGYATNATDMFRYAAQYKGPGIDKFKPSKPKLDANPDTSTTWPVIVPEFPATIRDEMCRDTTEFIKDGLDTAYQIGGSYAAAWEDGVDLDEFNDMADDVGEEVTKSAKKAFEMATENFRPKPTPKVP